MSIVGTFKQAADGYEGKIFLPPFNAENVRIIVDHKRSDDMKAPTHRIYVGRLEIGSAMRKTVDHEHYQLSLTFDFPGLVDPIHATLMKDKEGEDYSVHWARRRKVVCE